MKAWLGLLYRCPIINILLIGFLHWSNRLLLFVLLVHLQLILDFRKLLCQLQDSLNLLWVGGSSIELDCLNDTLGGSEEDVVKLITDICLN